MPSNGEVTIHLLKQAMHPFSESVAASWSFDIKASHGLIAKEAPQTKIVSQIKKMPKRRFRVIIFTMNKNKFRPT